MGFWVLFGLWAWTASRGEPYAPGLHQGIIYRVIGDDTLHLDAYVPEGTGPHPAAILIHGGGWVRGYRGDEISLLFDPLGRAGFAWFSIDYRLAPTHRWPACLEDAMEAGRWVVRNAAAFRCDPRQLILIGYSAGGQIALMAGYSLSWEISLRALVGLAPPTDLVQDAERRGGLSPYLQALLGRPAELDEEARRLLQMASPFYRIRTGLVPILLVHGEADQSVPIGQSRSFCDRLSASGVPCDLYRIPEAPHRITEWLSFDPGWIDGLIQWISNRCDTY